MVSKEKGIEVKVTILPEKREILLPVGENLLIALRKKGLNILSPCNGAGTCGQCKVRFEQDAPTPIEGDRRFLNSQEIEDGWRLSCLHEVKGEAAIYLVAQAGELDTKAQVDSLSYRPRSGMISERISSGCKKGWSKSLWFRYRS